jgi:organic hydroperoxide reductase OsmC/OhrA
MKVLYTAEATATGGRNGQVKSEWCFRSTGKGT